MNDTIFNTEERIQKIGSQERVISAVSGGVLLGYGLYGKSWLRIPMLVLGGGLLLRGLTGYSLLYRMVNIYRSKDRIAEGIRVERSTTIHRPVTDVFAYWQQLENLPRFMDHLETVQVRDNNLSHWVAKAPLGIKVEWDAEITDLQENEVIAWRSLPGSSIENAGEVRFKPAPGNRGTEVYVTLEYKAPGGSAGAALAKLFGEEPDIQVREDLRRFKAIMETGEVISTEGQPSGRAT